MWINGHVKQTVCTGYERKNNYHITSATKVPAKEDGGGFLNKYCLVFEVKSNKVSVSEYTTSNGNSLLYGYYPLATVQHLASS